MKFSSILKPEGSVVSGIATAGGVWAIYQMQVGPVSQAYASEANHNALESSRKKAGYMSFIFVSAITLLTRDSGVGLLGYGSIVANEVSYRHAIMADPNTGIVQPPSESTYQAAGNVVPINSQGQVA
jgi:hypothetical protein